MEAIAVAILGAVVSALVMFIVKNQREDLRGYRTEQRESLHELRNVVQGVDRRLAIMEDRWSDLRPR